MANKFFFLILGFILPTLTTSQDPIGCFKKGECVHSLIVDYATTDSAESCLKYCKDHATCKYFTFNSFENFCVAFGNCVDFSTSCDSCVSGDVSCSDPQCFVPGHCDGTSVAILPGTYSSLSCLEDCKANVDCGWFSYNSSNNVCVLTEDCIYLDTDCTACVSGQRYCSSDLTSTTQWPTTDTTVWYTFETTEQETHDPTMVTTYYPFTTTTEPTTKPWTEPTTEPWTEPTTEPWTEPTTEPWTEPTTEPWTEPWDTTTSYNDFTCGVNLTNEYRGALVSPNYPNDYNNDVSCQSIIRTAYSLDRFHVSFTDFQVEDCGSNDCICDKLEIRDGSSSSSPLLFSGCGSTIPDDLVTSGNALFVSFTTDFSETRRGWRFEFHI